MSRVCPFCSHELGDISGREGCEYQCPSCQQTFLLSESILNPEKHREQIEEYSAEMEQALTAGYYDTGRDAAIHGNIGCTIGFIGFSISIFCLPLFVCIIFLTLYFVSFFKALRNMTGDQYGDSLTSLQGRLYASDVLIAVICIVGLVKNGL